MAIVIDFGEPSHRTKTPVSAVETPAKPADLKRATFESCRHHAAVIDEEKRTVTCKACGTLLDPFAYILLLYGYYETRVDHRIAAIKEAERIDAERAKRHSERKEKPLRRKIERRAETAERAARNEYQAKVLAARAERQRQLVATLDSDILASTVAVPRKGL